MIHENTETKIIDVAKQMFSEKGFNETSMSDIAARMGMNRPGLHYYFRTKQLLYTNVFGRIVASFLPQICEIVVDSDIPLDTRVGRIVDVYYDSIFKDNPYLPTFLAKEINRDATLLVDGMRRLGINHDLFGIATALLSEMDAGTIRRVPLRYVFLTFYGMLTMPFLSRGLLSELFLSEDENFEMMLKEWKGYIVSQMHHLLCVDRTAEQTD